MTEPVKNIALADYTYYRIGGIAREAYFPVDCGEFSETVDDLGRRGVPYFILGGGTNVLIGDGFFDGAVIITVRMNKYEARNDRLVCGAGLMSSDVAEIALAQGRTGLEFLYRLPGTIGGAIAGNARFDDTNVSDVLISVTAIHPEYGLKTFDAAGIDFAYKHNRISAEGWYICGADLTWREGDTVDIRENMDRIERFRSDRHHFDNPSCGCVFKNDHDKNIQVGRLLDSLGLKGKRVGDAEVAPFHANFIINTGNATAREVLSLIQRIEEIVKEKTGVALEREVKVYGSFE